MTTQIVKPLTLAGILATSIITTGFAETYEGTIQGANCVINDIDCAKDKSDPHLCLEREFVLVTGEGEYFFLPNLERSLTRDCYKQDVKVTGQQKGKTIRAETLEVRKANKYHRVWDRKKYGVTWYDD